MAATWRSALRIALLSMIEHVVPGQGSARAFLRIGGVSLARHQLGVARVLGCQRIVCLARSPCADLIALQHDAESSGMKFHILSDAAGLSRLVTATDELLVLSEGLLAEPESVAQQLDGLASVLVQPADGAVEAGFERIDAELASAGAMLLPGRLAEPLHDLPPDCDVASALLRIALQHGVRRRQLPAGMRSGTFWRLVATEQDAQAIGDEWVRRNSGEKAWASPGQFAARAAAIGIGPSLIQSRKGVTGLAVLIAALLTLALGLACAGMGKAGFAVCACAWVLLRLHLILGGIERRITRGPVRRLWLSEALAWVFDAVLVAIAVAEATRAGSISLSSAIFAAAMLVLLVRIADKVFDGWIRDLTGDRSLLCLGLVAAALSGMILAFVQIVAGALATAIIIGLARARSPATNA